MEKLTELKRWVMGSGLVQGLSVDSLGAMPGDTGLFPEGTRLLWQRQDILGNTTSRLREVFTLRRKAVPGMTSAGWIIAFARWISENQSLAPVFGAQQRIYTEKGSLVSAAAGGEGLYELRIIVEYTSKQEGE